MQGAGRVSGPLDVQVVDYEITWCGIQASVPMYKLKFEDDDDQEHHVSAQWVVEWPGGP